MLFCNFCFFSFSQISKYYGKTVDDYFVLSSPIDMNGFSKQCIFATFFKVQQKLCRYECQKQAKIQEPFKKQMCCFSVFHLNVTCRTLRELSRMSLVSLVTFALRKKCLNTEFSGPYFPVFGLNRGKYGPEKLRI